MATEPRTERKAHPVLWTLGAIFIAVIVILILGAVPDGDPVIKNPEALITQILVTAGVIGAATLPLLIKTQRDAAVARDQVANDHVTEEGKQINLRVDQDEKHSEVVDLVTHKFDGLTKHFNIQFDGVRSDIRGIRADVGRNTNGLEKTRDKLEEHIEDSRVIIGRFNREIKELHKLNVSLEDTLPTLPTLSTTEEEEEDNNTGGTVS